MKTFGKSILIITFSLCFIILSGSLFKTVGQEPQTTRGGTFSEDFSTTTKSVSAQIVKSRRTSVKTSKSAAIKAKNYSLRRKSPQISLTAKAKINASAKTTNRQNNPNSKETSWEEIGFTVWKLRKKLPNEDSVSLSVVEKGIRVDYVPERIESGAMLKLGDKVRLTIESPRNGFLYVADTEIYSDGSFGKPTLIFPTQRTRGGDNRVSAGVLVDIPAQDDDVPFFVINSKNPAYAGELLSVLISSENLNGFSTPAQARSLEPETIDEWTADWGLEAEVFEQEGGNGAKWTTAEKEAGQANGRSLTQEDSTPQTVYRVRADKRKPIFVNLALGVSRN